MKKRHCVFPTDKAEEIKKALDIRKQVFQNEQHVKKEIDFDGLEYESLHMIYEYDGIYAATLRIRFPEEANSAQIERVAVLKQYRNRNFATRLLEETLKYLKNIHIKKAFLFAQLKAKNLYLKTGFQEVGDIFVAESGIPHIRMEMSLENKEI